jgi:hypothetical protein
LALPTCFDFIYLLSSIIKGLLDFYFLPIETNVQHPIVEGLKVELKTVKGAQSKEKLAYK